jgi:hypothetical protein
MTPLLCGYMPLARLARLGLHCGAVAKQLANRAPSRANASRFGLTTLGRP